MIDMYGEDRKNPGANGVLCYLLDGRWKKFVVTIYVHTICQYTYIYLFSLAFRLTDKKKVFLGILNKRVELKSVHVKNEQF